MKLLIPSEGDNLSSKFSERFARASFFVFYDTENDNFIAEKSSFGDAQSGVGTRVSQYLADKGVNTAIAYHFGPKASDALKAFGIKQFVFEGDIANKTVSNIIEDFKNKTLKEL